MRSSAHRPDQEDPPPDLDLSPPHSYLSPSELEAAVARLDARMQPYLQAARRLRARARHPEDPFTREATR